MAKKRGLTHDVVMVRLSAIGESVVIIAVCYLALVVLDQVAPDWSETLRFIVGIGAALVALWVTRAAVERAA